MSDIVIRKAVKTDADALFKLNELFNGEGCSTKELILDCIKHNEKEDVFVAIQQDKAVGFCCVQLFRSMCYSQNYAEITELFVLEECRNKGVATKLMMYLEDYYNKNYSGIAGYQLFTGDDNVTARRFYENIGYENTGEVMYRKRK